MKANFLSFVSVLSLVLVVPILLAEETLTLEQVKVAGDLTSAYKHQKAHRAISKTPEPDLTTFEAEIKPILADTCLQCHGPKKQKGDFRIDTLDPDLLQGEDVDWWLDVFDVLTLVEMPPEDEEEMPVEDRAKVIDWLSSEIQLASEIRRSEDIQSSFRRMTRYEYNYALQDLLGLNFDLADDLPPETRTEDGFENNSEMLQMSVVQFQTYREIGRKALQKATVRGAQPAPIYYGISMEDGHVHALTPYAEEVESALEKFRDDPVRLREALNQLESEHFESSSRVHIVNLDTKEYHPVGYSHRKAANVHYPIPVLPEVPAEFQYLLVIPIDEDHEIDLGDTLPDNGTLKVRALVSHVSNSEERVPSLRLHFGFKGSNNASSYQRVSSHDKVIDGFPDQPQFYEWEFPLDHLRRNPFRNVKLLGGYPNPSEYLVFQNATPNPERDKDRNRDRKRDWDKDRIADIQIHYLEVTAPYYEQWPPESHTRIFLESKQKENEEDYAREVLASFMPRAWRRSVTDAEIDRHLTLFNSVRPQSIDFQEAMIEVLATVLASPKFLYLVQHDPEKEGIETLSDYELATRLSMFLWSSTPDEELLELASKKKLKSPRVLLRQTQRMLADPRSERFSKHFVQQWLGMHLLGYLEVDEDLYPRFDDALKEAMQEEPMAFFKEVLRENGSIMDFLHADYAMVNERLAGHYGLPDVLGNQFRRVKLSAAIPRGGLMTQAGLLAMNSDGKGSHPLKRSIWLLEHLLNDPPPPPPAAVPEIDLTDPEVAKMTLKERMEDHRNDPACMSLSCQNRSLGNRF